MTGRTTTRRYAFLVACAAAALSLISGPLPFANAATFTPLAAESKAPSAHSASAHALRTASTRAAASAAAAAAATAAATAAAAMAAATAIDFSSIFTTQVPSLSDSGWTTCAPITWSVDTRGLSADEAATQIENIQWAFGEWTLASGLTFEFTGNDTLAYDDAAFTLTPADGSQSKDRHIYLAFVADADSARLGDLTVGLGSPSQVWPTTKEIVNGEAVFRTDHVQQASVPEVRSLYIHELGHVLGLAHANQPTNIMYSVVSDKTELGTGDVNGVRSMTKPCTQAA